mmetsp:Transcript_38430/g.70495  ORF Transcript_38430/g.70495 Transcript_38430/m.70495 type:complete len:132 (-) Transcript_38430:481-876(-)
MSPYAVVYQYGRVTAVVRRIIDDPILQYLACWLRLTAGCGLSSLSSKRQGLILTVSRQVMAGHHRPPTITAGRGRPSLSSQCRGRLWPAILNNKKLKDSAASAVQRMIIRGIPFTPINCTPSFPRDIDTTK